MRVRLLVLRPVRVALCFLRCAANHDLKGLWTKHELHNIAFEEGEAFFWKGRAVLLVHFLA